jgi:hypothetical protein
MQRFKRLIALDLKIMGGEKYETLFVNGMGRF